MTQSDFRKVFKQLKAKPVILTKYIKYNSPKVRTCGRNIIKCRSCGRKGAHIAKYDMNLCRQCFREVALHIGWKKYG